MSEVHTECPMDAIQVLDKEIAGWQHTLQNVINNKKEMLNVRHWYPDWYLNIQVSQMDEYIKTAEYNISQKTYEKSILVKNYK